MNRNCINVSCRIAGAILLCVGLVPGSLVAGESDLHVKSSQSHSRVFEGPIKRLAIDTFWGSITVRAHNRSAVEVQIVETLRARSDDWAQRARSEVELQVREANGSVEFYVDGPFREPHNKDSGKNLELHYEAVFDFVVFVPHRIDLELQTVLESGILVEGVNGKVQLHDVVGPIRLHNAVVSGSIETVSESIEAQLSEVPPGALAFKSISGNIDLLLPRDLAANLEISSSWGTAWSEFELVSYPVLPEIVELGNGHTAIRTPVPTARIGGGGNQLVLSTLSGDINLRKNP